MLKVSGGRVRTERCADSQSGGKHRCKVHEVHLLLNSANQALPTREAPGRANSPESPGPCQKEMGKNQIWFKWEVLEIVPKLQRSCRIEASPSSYCGVNIFFFWLEPMLQYGVSHTFPQQLTMEIFIHHTAVKSQDSSWVFTTPGLQPPCPLEAKRCQYLSPQQRTSSGKQFF